MHANLHAQSTQDSVQPNGATLYIIISYSVSIRLKIKLLIISARMVLVTLLTDYFAVEGEQMQAV
jgi:hypothetical protein